MRELPQISVPAWALKPRAGAAISVLALAAITSSLAPLLGEDELVAVSMLFLLVVLLASALWGYAVGIGSALLADVLLNFFFVPPHHTITVQEPRNVAALIVFLAVAVVGASMLALLRRQLALARERRAELTIMLGLSRDLAAAPSPERAIESLAKSIGRAVKAKRCDILRMNQGRWDVIASTGDIAALTREESSLAQMALESGTIARRHGDGHSSKTSVRYSGHAAATDTFIPFRSSGGESGVIRVVGQPMAPAGGDLDALFRAFADEAGVAIHRARLAEQARQADAMRRSDELKSALLSSVSHDLRSPLTAIKAAVGSLRSNGIEWSEAERGELLETIESQTDRLTGTVSGLMDMSRLEAGAVEPTLEPVLVTGILQDAVLATRVATAERQVCVESPDDLWARADYALLLQALTNLIENAANYSNPGAAIHLRGQFANSRVVLEVADEGPGITQSDLPHIFERFYRGGAVRRVKGTGLGLAIVRAMVELCGGRVDVESSPAGTTFRINLAPARPR